MDRGRRVTKPVISRASLKAGDKWFGSLASGAQSYTIRPRLEGLLTLGCSGLKESSPLLQYGPGKGATQSHSSILPLATTLAIHDE